MLVAHGAGADADLLVRMVAAEELLPELSDLVWGFVDTLHVFRKALPQRVAQAQKGAGDFKLENLAQHYGVLGQNDRPHNAEDDVVLLDKVIKAIGVSDQQLVQAAKPLAHIRAYKETTTS